MRGTYVKIIQAQQAKICNYYKNTKLKLLKTNAAIWFNKITYVTWQGINCELPEDDTIVLTHLGAV
jgi:hypothetical protein